MGLTANAVAPAAIAELRAGAVSHSPAGTARFAAALAAALPPNTALALHGALGAGKTTFTQHFAHALGVSALVTSPSFAIFSVYQTPARQLVHMDAYRLNSPADADGLLLWDILEPPWTLVVEWPEKLGDRLPEDAWHLHIEISGENERCLKLGGGGG
jgi:tRNA threonylcarbamoyladenosine biosynthesis protein TsaE